MLACAFVSCFLFIPSSLLRLFTLLPPFWGGFLYFFLLFFFFRGFCLLSRLRFVFLVFDAVRRCSLSWCLTTTGSECYCTLLCMFFVLPHVFTLFFFFLRFSSPFSLIFILRHLFHLLSCYGFLRPVLLSLFIYSVFDLILSFHLPIFFNVLLRVHLFF